MGNAKQHAASHITQFRRLPYIKQRFSVSGSTIWSWIKQGKFPPGIKISDNITVWEDQTLESWAADRISASQAGK
ncbi:MAG: AlpA family phage regulatory protein [Candidatus Nitrotoga sp.]|nr:AlpA family phage regulatory protein [Candidatus Nitrotoga sp.]